MFINIVVTSNNSVLQREPLFYKIQQSLINLELYFFILAHCLIKFLIMNQTILTPIF